MPIEPFNSIPSESASARHNRMYTLLLIAFGLLCGLGTISIGFLSRSPTIPPESKRVFQATVWINAALIAAMVATLILRATAPAAGRIATKALNIVLLFMLPLGTALGIYGLMKVDKDQQPGGV